MLKSWFLMDRVLHPLLYQSIQKMSGISLLLGGADEFEPIFGGGGMGHAHEAGGDSIVAGCDGAVDFHLVDWS